VASQPVESPTSQTASALSSPRRPVTRSQIAQENPNSPTATLPGTSIHTAAAENSLFQQICTPRRPLTRSQTTPITPKSQTPILESSLSQALVAQNSPSQICRPRRPVNTLQGMPSPSKRKTAPPSKYAPPIGTSEPGDDFDLG